LLDVRASPTTESGEIGERLHTVIVGVPQGESRASSVRAHDGVPLGRGSVNSEVNAQRSCFAGHGGEEVCVGALAASPVHAWSFNIQPDLSVSDIVGLEVVEEGAHLPCGVSAREAREKVDIHVSHSSGPCVGDGGGAVRVDGAGRAVAPHDGEGIAIGLQAPESTRADQSRYVNAING
jgi:hypothetical protein